MPELIEVLAPSEQEGTESTVLQWLKQPGDTVAEHEPLVELETDKVTVEVPAPVSGVLKEIVLAQQASVGPGDLLGRIEPGEQVTQQIVTPRESPVAAAPGKGAGATSSRLSPAVRRLLVEHGLDASDVAGSGRDGRITHQDVLAHIARRSEEASAEGAPGSRKVPHSAVRRRVASHMLQSVQTAPHVTAVFEADLATVLAHRASQRAGFEDRGVKLTLTAYFVRAAVAALEEVPEANARFHEDFLEIFEDFNIGIGTALERDGLIVPVIRRAQDLDLFETAKRLQELTSRAREGSLSPEEVRSGTFTISNHGVSGSLVATPIVINQPQTAILGIGKLEKRAVVVERDGREVIEPQPRCYVTLTIDHRALDGFQANAFLTRFVASLENFSE